MKRHILKQLKGLQYFALVLRHTFSKVRLGRVPEPHTLTDQQAHVDDYSRAIDSVMILPYVLVLDMVHRLGAARNAKRAVDLCCGPGHFTRMLAKSIPGIEVMGVDLSEPMLAKAQENSEKENLSRRLHYLKSDVADLQAVASKSLDIVSFMDGAHHMNSIEQVSEILLEADRVAKNDGTIILIDPVRPKTHGTAEMYHRIAGQAYVDLGLTHFNQDFKDSLLASWSTDELFDAIPRKTDRVWVQLIPFGFPSFQIVIGLPVGRKDLFIRDGLSPEVVDQLIPDDGKADWRMLRLSFLLATIKVIEPSRLQHLAAEGAALQ